MTFTILAPLDGSPFGEAALPMAAKLAQAEGARLVLANIFPEPKDSVRDESGRVISYVDQEDASLRQEALVYLKSIANNLVETYGLKDVATEAQSGEPVEGIVRMAGEQAADLIVMATHGRTGVARVLLGSVAGTVLRRANIPVTLVRPATLADLPEGE